MVNRKKLLVSHAPFWHDGSAIPERNYGIILAALPAVFFGILRFGMPAIGMTALAVSSALLWEFGMDRLSKRPTTIGDGHAAMIGLLLAMLLPATAPWWAVVTGTFIAVILGKQIFGGIGGYSYSPVILAMAMLTVSWGHILKFDAALVGYDFSFNAVYPLGALKNFGVNAVEGYSTVDLLLGKQAGGFGATCGLALIAGGIYLMIKGIIRWEVSVSYLAGVAITAGLFHAADPTRFANPVFHLVTGYTLIAAFFILTEDATSPVNFVPMLIYGAGAGVLTILIRNIGAYSDGVVYAVLIANTVNPLLDKMRPKALGKEA